jgi:hypothetical protein
MSATTAHPAQGPVGPLSGEQLEQIEQANARSAKLRKVGGVALFNGCTIGFFAATSLLFALISPVCGGFDFTALVMAVGLGLVAYNEFKGRTLIRRFELRGPRLLGWNQVCLMVLVIGYCAWMIVTSLIAPNPLAAELKAYPELGQMKTMFGSMGDLPRLLTLAVYGTMIVATVIFQGLNAVYYFSRAKLLRAYLAQTPPWIVEVQRRTAGT